LTHIGLSSAKVNGSRGSLQFRSEGAETSLSAGYIEGAEDRSDKLHKKPRIILLLSSIL
jgi:hypothetical protein